MSVVEGWLWVKEALESKLDFLNPWCRERKKERDCESENINLRATLSTDKVQRKESYGGRGCIEHMVAIARQKERQGRKVKYDYDD